MALFSVSASSDTDMIDKVLQHIQITICEKISSLEWTVDYLILIHGYLYGLIMKLISSSFLF